MKATQPKMLFRALNLFISLSVIRKNSFLCKKRSKILTYFS
jgi:hypothetical protein